MPSKTVSFCLGRVVLTTGTGTVFDMELLHVYSVISVKIYTMIFYFLLSKLISLCMAIGFAAFSCQSFVKNSQNHKILAHCDKTQICNTILLPVRSV